MRVESVRLRLLLIAPLRLALGVALLVSARAAGSPDGPALIAFAVGAFALVFLVSNDPRAGFRRAPGKPEPLPEDARIAPAWLHAAHAALPSTVGVSLLAAIALPFKPVLAALLAGVLVGLGLAALLHAFRIDPRLYYEVRSSTLFRRP